MYLLPISVPTLRRTIVWHGVLTLHRVCMNKVKGPRQPRPSTHELIKSIQSIHHSININNRPFVCCCAASIAPTTSHRRPPRRRCQKSHSHSRHHHGRIHDQGGGGVCQRGYLGHLALALRVVPPCRRRATWSEGDVPRCGF